MRSTTFRPHLKHLNKQNLESQSSVSLNKDTNFFFPLTEGDEQRSSSAEDNTLSNWRQTPCSSQTQHLIYYYLHLNIKAESGDG